MTLDNATCATIQKAMQKELRRAKRGLELPGHPKPFFLSHLLHVIEGHNVWGRYGTVYHSQPIFESSLYAEVRVGSYRFDQFIDGGLTTDLSERESYNWMDGPQELTPDAVRYSLWKLTQLKYEEALQDYYEKKKILVEQRLQDPGASFSKETPVVHNEEVQGLRMPKKRWERFVREASAEFRRFKSLHDPYIRVQGMRKVRIFVNSEGSRFVTEDRFYELVIKSWHLSDDGTYLSASRQFYGRNPKALPGIAKVRAAIQEIADELRALAKSKPLPPYAGPALLSGLASGLLFHEAIGHRLEGERMTSRAEGHTFSEKIGERILPEEIDIVDDPSLETWEGEELYGHYSVDDEGVLSKPVPLVKGGVLRNYLMSRACTNRHRASNGHSRHERYRDRGPGPGEPGDLCLESGHRVLGRRAGLQELRHERQGICVPARLSRRSR